MVFSQNRITVYTKKYLPGLFTIIVISLSIIGGFSAFSLKDVTVKTNYVSLELSMTMNKTIFTIDEVIPIEVKLTNIGNESTTIEFVCGANKKHPPHLINPKILDASSNLVYHFEFFVFYFEFGVYWSFSEIVLEPGESMKWIHRWRQIDVDGKRVPTGSYKIIGLIRYVWKPSGLRDLQTPPIDIIIT